MGAWKGTLDFSADIIQIVRVFKYPQFSLLFIYINLSFISSTNTHLSFLVSATIFTDLSPYFYFLYS